jgi:hypothetical protein
MTDTTTYRPQVLSDMALAQRLERAEARGNASFVEARAKLEPECGAEWMEVAGAYAMFDGVGSPMTQTFGLGVFGPVGAEEMERLEGFFKDRGSEVFHEVSPMADAALLPLLVERGYRPMELSSVLYLPLTTETRVDGRRDAEVTVRPVGEGETEGWAALAARGWSDMAPEMEPFFLAISRINAVRAEVHGFVAEIGGEPIATGAMSVHEGVALLAGASTVPEGRGRGAQLALLDARLRHAAALGCDLAMMAALPGSTSQKNAERQGFHIAYTRIKWHLTPS